MPKKISRPIIGIDVGGTKIVGVLWNGKKVLKTAKIETPKNLKDFKIAILKLVNLLSLAKADILVGVGCAGIIKGKKVVKSPNIPFLKNFNFSLISKDVKIEKLENDAKCFALAEYMALSHKKTSVFFITIGTGLGRAVAKKGKILNIKKFEYPEKWEKEYQKIRDSSDNQKLSEFIAKKITKLAKPYNPETIVAGGGLLGKKGFFSALKKEFSIPLKKSVFKNSAAIGAAIMCKPTKNVIIY